MVTPIHPAGSKTGVLSKSCSPHPAFNVTTKRYGFIHRLTALPESSVVLVWISKSYQPQGDGN